MILLRPALPIVLLVLMTVATLGGPLVFGLVLRGGASPAWPPDRAVEWWALGLVTAFVVGVMVATVGTSLALERREKRARLNLKRQSEAPRSETAHDR